MSIFSKNIKPIPRQLNNVSEVVSKDIIIFKDTLQLPQQIRKQSAEVVKVASYEYKAGFEPEFSLRTSGDETYYLSTEEETGEIVLTISRRIQRNIVELIFNVDDIGAILEEGFSSLRSLNTVPEEYAEWVSEGYNENTDCLQAYFHKTDNRGKTPAEYSDGAESGEELQYFECTSADGNYGISIEVYSSENTEISLFRRFDESVIQDLLPHGE